jgi:hypothetical protein
MWAFLGCVLLLTSCAAVSGDATDNARFIGEDRGSAAYFGDLVAGLLLCQPIGTTHMIYSAISTNDPRRSLTKHRSKSTSENLCLSFLEAVQRISLSHVGT